MGYSSWGGIVGHHGVTKHSTAQHFDSWVGTISWRRKWQPTPIFSPGKSHGQRNLTVYSPSGRNSQTRLSELTTTTLSSKK